MIKKILVLSKIFIKDYFQNLNVFNKNKKKVNKKSVFFWLLIITIFAITFLSFKLINWLDMAGQAILFLKAYLPIMASIFMFQAILICTNVFFFSKDLEYILPFPIKPIELLIAKFNNVISITYGMEAIFLLIPLIIYGIVAGESLLYFPVMGLILIIFPIFFITIISIIMLFVMQLTRFIKNKEIFQIIMVIIVSFVMSSTELYLIATIFSDDVIHVEINENNEVENAELRLEVLNRKLDNLNNYFVTINPSIKVLTNINAINLIFELAKLILISIGTFLIFLFFGKILYLKNLLKNIAYINKKKNIKKIGKIKYKKNKIRNAYIKNEFKKIIKNPTFFLQGVFQYIFLIIIILSIVNLFFPITIQKIQEEKLLEKMNINDFAIQSICIILGTIQLIYTFSNLSMTSISREGKNAFVLKYIPVSLYKQFLWKSIPQIFFNMIAIIGMTVVVIKNIPPVSIWYYMATIIIAILLNIINSFIMLIIDLKRPNLNWITETSALKDNGNKLYQYVTTIIVILILGYFVKVFGEINIVISLSIIILFCLIILYLINIYVKKNINKLYKNIY